MRKEISKYHSRKTVIDGITFMSKKEAKRYQELLLLEKAGEIMALQRQVKYVLIPAQYETIERYSKTGKRLKDGKRCIEKECAYYADFTYFDVNLDTFVVEDTKGMKTKDYIMKRKLMLYVNGIRIREI